LYTTGKTFENFARVVYFGHTEVVTSVNCIKKPQLNAINSYPCYVRSLHCENNPKSLGMETVHNMQNCIHRLFNTAAA